MTIATKTFTCPVLIGWLRSKGFR